MDNDFDTMCRELDTALARASEWKHLYYGAAYSSRIKMAIRDLEASLAKIKLHPELAASK